MLPDDLDALHDIIQHASAPDLKEIYEKLTYLRTAVDSEPNEKIRLLKHHRLMELHVEFYHTVKAVDPSPKYFGTEKYPRNFWRRYRYDSIVQHYTFLESLLGSNRLKPNYIEFYLKHLCVFMQPSVNFTLYTNNHPAELTSLPINVSRSIVDPTPGYKPSYRLVYAYGEIEFETMNYLWSRFVLRQKWEEFNVYVASIDAHHRLFFDENHTKYWLFVDDAFTEIYNAQRFFKRLGRTAPNIVPRRKEVKDDTTSGLSGKLIKDKPYMCFAWYGNEFSLKSLTLHGKVDQGKGVFSLVENTCTSSVFNQIDAHTYTWGTTLCRVYAIRNTAIVYVNDTEYYLLRVVSRRPKYEDVIILLHAVGLNHENVATTYFISRSGIVPDLRLFSRPRYLGNSSVPTEGDVYWEGKNVHIGDIVVYPHRVAGYYDFPIDAEESVKVKMNENDEWIIFYDDLFTKAWVYPKVLHPVTDWGTVVPENRKKYVEKFKVA